MKDLSPRQHRPISRRAGRATLPGITPSGCSALEWIKCAGVVAGCIASAPTGVGIAACVAAAAAECLPCV